MAEPKENFDCKIGSFPAVFATPYSPARSILPPGCRSGDGFPTFSTTHHRVIACVQNKPSILGGNNPLFLALGLPSVECFDTFKEQRLHLLGFDAGIYRGKCIFKS